MGTEKKEIVGMIRGCIKTVTCGQKLDLNHKSQNDVVKPLYTKLAYVLGLRVSPFHRYPSVFLPLIITRYYRFWLSKLVLVFAGDKGLGLSS